MSRNRIILQVGGDQFVRNIKIIPRRAPIYLFDLQNVETHKSNFTTSILNAPLNTVFLVETTKSCNGFSEGLILNPYLMSRLVQIIENDANSHFLNATLYLSERDHEIITNL